MSTLRLRDAGGKRWQRLSKRLWKVRSCCSPNVICTTVFISQCEQDDVMLYSWGAHYLLHKDQVALQKVTLRQGSNSSGLLVKLGCNRRRLPLLVYLSAKASENKKGSSNLFSSYHVTASQPGEEKLRAKILFLPSCACVWLSRVSEPSCQCQLQITSDCTSIKV